MSTRTAVIVLVLLLVAGIGALVLGPALHPPDEDVNLQDPSSWMEDIQGIFSRKCQLEPADIAKQNPGCFQTDPRTKDVRVGRQGEVWIKRGCTIPFPERSRSRVLAAKPQCTCPSGAVCRATLRVDDHRLSNDPGIPFPKWFGSPDQQESPALPPRTLPDDDVGWHYNLGTGKAKLRVRLTTALSNEWECKLVPVKSGLGGC